MRSLKTYLVLTVASAFLILSRGMIDFNSPDYAGFDLHHYRFIAQAVPHISPKIQAPFAYRILGPYIVGLLPVPDPLGFRIATSIACFVLVLVFYQFLMSEGIDSYFAAVAVLLFACNRYFFGLMVWDPFQIDDVLAMLCIVASLMLLARRRWIWLALCFALGALTREVVMILVPVSFAYLWERGTLRRDFSRWLMALAPAVLIFILVRMFAYADGWRMGMGGILPYYELKFGETVGNAFTLVAWTRRLVWCFMPFTVLPLIFPRSTISFFSRRKYALFYLVLVIITNFWGIDENGGDTERLMAPSFLAFYWLISYLLQVRLSRPRWIAPAILACGYLGSLHHLQGVYPLPNKEATFIVTMVALVAVTGIGLWVRWRGVPRENLSTS